MAKGQKTGGRSRGTPNKATAANAAEVAQSGMTPLDYMLTVLRDKGEPHDRRQWAAQNAAPYVHPRLAAVEHTGDPDKPVKLEVIQRVIVRPADRDAGSI